MLYHFICLVVLDTRLLYVWKALLLLTLCMYESVLVISIREYETMISGAQIYKCEMIISEDKEQTSYQKCLGCQRSLG